MSTRATIKITKGNYVIRLYHHHDGYPQGVGEAIKNQLTRLDRKIGAHYTHLVSGMSGYWKPFDIANDLIKDTEWSFELTAKIHGDEDYFYLIDCDNKELHCYEMCWDEPEEDIVKPENEVEI